MKKIILAFTCLFALACNKRVETITPGPQTKTQTSTSTSSSSTTSTSTIPANVVNVKDHGAKGDGVTDDTQSIANSIAFAVANKIPTVYFPQGTYSIQQVSSNSTGVIQLVNGISLQGAGPAVSKIVLSGGRYNPQMIFYQDLYAQPVISNIVIQGLDFNGSLSAQKYDTDYQFSHAISINNGSNIEVKNCKFESFRGDGCLFGDTFLASLNLHITTNVNVHDSEFTDIYREGTMFCCVKGASFYNNYVHGNGYLVGGVDIERHSANESVLNVSVYNNIFDFRDGTGPVERGGPIASYRRAVTMAFFYKGYTNGIADGLSGGHKVYSNTIYQGQIDCWGHTNVSITNNTFSSVYENIAGIGWLSSPAINISDPAVTKGLVNVTVSGNVINSAMNGNGLLFQVYSQLTVKNNTISGVQSDGINILNATGTFDSNNIKTIGTATAPVSGLVVNGNCPGLIISNNIVTDTNIGTARTINYAVAIQSKDNATAAPQILSNEGINLIKGVVSEFWGQLNYIILKGNVSK